MSLTPVHETHEEYKILSECIGRTQQNNQFQIENILKIDHLNDVDFQSELNDQCYLYHSTYINNMISVLQEG